MIILLLQDSNPFTTNSAYSNHIRGLIEGLESLNADVTVFITGGYKSREEFVTQGKSGKVGNIKYEYLWRINNYTRWSSRVHKYLLSPFHSIIIRRRFERILKNIPEAIIWPSDDLCHLKTIAAINKRQGYYYFFEMVEFLDIHKYNKGNILQKLIADKQMSFFEKEFLPSVDGMAFITKALLNYYKTKVQSVTKLLHLPMTVDLERFDLNRNYPLFSEIKKPYIAFVGVKSNLKEGVDILIDSFNQIALEFPEMNLYIFGFWHYDSPGHQERIKELNLENRIFYKRTIIPRDDISGVIMNANLLALPRPDSHQAQGSFPTKLGEYLASGNPVCATRVGEIPEYLTDGESVYFAEPGSVDSFADAMRRALNNPSQAKLVGLKGRNVAETFFNKDKQAKLLYDFFQS